MWPPSIRHHDKMFTKIIKRFLRDYDYKETKPGVYHKQGQPSITLPFFIEDNSWGMKKPILDDVYKITGLTQDNLAPCMLRSRQNKITILFFEPVFDPFITPWNLDRDKIAHVSTVIMEWFSTVLAPQERHKIALMREHMRFRLARGRLPSYIRLHLAAGRFTSRWHTYKQKNGRDFKCHVPGLEFIWPLNTDPNDLLCLFAQRFFKTFHDVYHNKASAYTKGANLSLFRCLMEQLEEKYAMIHVESLPASDLYTEVKKEQEKNV